MKSNALILSLVLFIFSGAAGRAHALTTDGKHKLVIIAGNPATRRGCTSFTRDRCCWPGA
jgi:hypothetical protein